MNKWDWWDLAVLCYLGNIHKLPVFLQKDFGFLCVISQPDVGLQQGVQQLSEPLYSLREPGIRYYLHNTAAITLHQINNLLFSGKEWRQNQRTKPCPERIMTHWSVYLVKVVRL